MFIEEEASVSWNFGQKSKKEVESLGLGGEMGLEVKLIEIFWMYFLCPWYSICI